MLLNFKVIDVLVSRAQRDPTRWSMIASIMDVAYSELILRDHLSTVEIPVVKIVVTRAKSYRLPSLFKKLGTMQLKMSVNV